MYVVLIKSSALPKAGRACKEVGADLQAIRDQITAFDGIQGIILELELSDLLSSRLTAGGDYGWW